MAAECQKGMRGCVFERHATSKDTDSPLTFFQSAHLDSAEKLLASIASVAHVELKTKKAEDEIGSQLVIEGSEVKTHNPVSAPSGTSIQVKNLFFNVPARRNFLKSNTSELKYIY